MKKLAILVLTLLVLVFLVGCSGIKKQTATDEKSGKTQLTEPEDILAELNKLPAKERQDKLLSEATKEGEIIFYATYNNAELQEITKAFQKAYPSVKMKSFRDTTESLMDKAITEYRAGQQKADVIALEGAESYQLYKAGVYGKYKSPARNSMLNSFYDADGYFTSVMVTPEVFAWNTNKVKDADAPKTWQDLLDPEWKGKLGRTTHGGRWVAGILNVMGQEKGMEYLKQLANQEIFVASSNSALTEMLTAGQISVAFDIHVSNVKNSMEKGAPINFTFTEDIWFGSDKPIALAKKANHHYAAALAIDWMLSEEGQKIIASQNRVGGNENVTYPFGETVKRAKKVLLYSPLTIGPQYNEMQKLFEDLFVRKSTDKKGSVK